MLYIPNKPLLTESELLRAENYKALMKYETYSRKDKDNKMEDFLKIQEEERKNKKFLTEYVRKDLDLFYVNKVIRGMMKNIGLYDEREVLREDYRKLVVYVVRKMEK